MKYYISVRLKKDFDYCVSAVRSCLEKEGFGVLTEIDVQAAMKKKLNVDFSQYIILGACNPPFAYKALQVEPMIGTMLPCNVIVRALPEGGTEVAAVDPLASMQAVENPSLGMIAQEVRNKLQKVIECLG